MNIHYLTGDATEPKDVHEPRFIVHVCNDVGLWGAGFTAALDRKWVAARNAYNEWYDSWQELVGHQFKLGRIQLVRVDPDDNELRVVNMIAQRGVRSSYNPTPIVYRSLHLCLTRVGSIARDYGGSLHMPRIGCGLAGGEWEIVKIMLQEVISLYKLDIYVYDLPR